jgi:hypothetical protein
MGRLDLDAGVARMQSARMPSPTARELADEAVVALGRDLSVPVSRVAPSDAASPGLYGIHASPGTWRALGLGNPPDGRPLYVGKAEHTLASRDLQVHFGMRERGVQSPTGSSTVRRSLAALLAPRRDYHGMPRNTAKPGHFSNYGLSEEHDEDLSTWMRGRLRFALWPHDAASELDCVETLVLRQLLPPLNLDKVVTLWRAQVKAARKLLAGEARVWESR